jgi:AsmA protein
MRRPLKIAAITVAALLLLSGAAIAYVASAFDAARLKTELTKLVQEKTQRTLRIDGDLALSFWPGLGVKLGKASLSERGGDKNFAALDSARVSVRLIPLLSKQIVVDQVELSGLKATLLRHKDGTLNVDEGSAKGGSKEGDNKPEAQSVRFDVAGINLTNAQIDWRDELSGQNISVSDLNFSTGHLANAAKGKLKLSGKVVGSKPKADVSLQLSGQYDFDLDQHRFGLSQLDARLAGQIAAMQGLELTLAAATISASPGKGEIEVGALALLAKGKQGGDSLEFKLDAPKLLLTADQASGSTLSVVARLNGVQRKVDARLDLSGIEGSSKALKIARLALALDASAGETMVKGKLDSPFVANVPAKTMELSKLSGEFEIAHPKMPMKQVKLPVSGKLHADFARPSIEAALATQFDESKIAASFNVSRFTPLALGFDLDVDRLNVDKYLPPKVKAEGGKAGDGKAAGSEAASEKLDFSALKNLDLHGLVKVGALQMAGVKASHVRLNLKAAGGRLDVAPHSAELYGGSLNGALSLNANGNTVALKQNFTGININPLMKDALDKDVLEGRGNVALDVSTRGDTVDAMKQALSGSASLGLKDGALKGINLAQTFREAKAKISGAQDAVQQAKASDKTDFSELSASFRIAGGVAHNEDLAAKSPFLRLSGAGDIDIGRSVINYLAKASVVNTSGGQGAKELDALKGLTIPVRVTGPFSNVSYKIEFGNLVQEAAKAKVEEKKQEIEQKAKDQIKDRLKGLFQK